MANKNIADHCELYNQHTETEAFYSKCTASQPYFVHTQQHPSAQPKDIKPKRGQKLRSGVKQKLVKEAGITQDLYLMNSKFEGT